MSTPAAPAVRRAAWRDLDPQLAYAIARLRVDVFVVEQACPYPELDGRDLEPDAEHCWVPGGGLAVGAYLRVLADGDGDGARRVGRVVTAAPARGQGLAGALMGDVLARHGRAPLVLDAQAHLEHWYARWGFAPSGPGFLEDGIPHVPMRRFPTPP
ncbi:GNAT family N-acetyltransferase [Quadrisphaera sp. DSM 44207]|uniref:GNAT family N-acetyltransferase n=1 Tax=Quadrisphaera sp. DSM 44207 TaxID=1881057 RepID=UPI0008919F57|nr:GNAT family N-acetyltransferase [Quadrisphaera sp. DSM 44207]SDQ49369.1 ElaA protein [Quadrisphaera sp. DSM 44207]